MQIISLNINDFGGPDEHLENYKKIFGGYQGIREWDKIDKTQNVKTIVKLLLEDNSPDIIVLQEFDLNSKEAKEFDNIMKLNGFLQKVEKTEYKRPSMTVFYIKETIVYTYLSVGHTKNGRAYAIQIGELVVYGTHVPPKYDKQFWEEMHSFVKKYANEKYVLIGDFNTINHKNNNELDKLLNSSIDVWKAKGNENPISVAGDYAIVSKKINIDTVMIKINDLEQYADHPAIVLTV